MIFFRKPVSGPDHIRGRIFRDQLVTFAWLWWGLVAGAPAGEAQTVLTQALEMQFQRSVALNGLRISGIDLPNAGASTNVLAVNCIYRKVVAASNFSNQDCVDQSFSAVHGLNLYGVGTNAKTTFTNLYRGNFQASGQRIGFAKFQDCYGMGDCAVETQFVTYATADIAGDEGTGFGDVWMLQQQGRLTLGTVNSVARSACNTTATRSFRGSPNPQTITVGSSAGCKVGDWIVVNQQIASGQGFPNHEAVQITAVGGDTITGVFQSNQNSGVAITPATVLEVAHLAGESWGENRVIVNRSGESYSAGRVGGIMGAAYIGSGTSWSPAMVGGSSANIGCVRLAADDYSGPPFNGSGASGPLQSWYQIEGVSSTTSLAIFSFSVAGDMAYHGNGPGNGTYEIRPCVEVLRITDTGFSRSLGYHGTMVSETTGTTWKAGDSVEEVIPPYPDVHGFIYEVGQYNPGGIRRSFIQLFNTGARKWAGGISISSLMQKGGGADTTAWETGIGLSSVDVGIRIESANAAAITLCSQVMCGSSDNSSRIQLGGPQSNTGPFLMTNSSNGGISIGTLAGSGAAGYLNAYDNRGSRPYLQYDGMLGTTGSNLNTLPKCTAAAKGATMVINDSNTDAWGATISGNGTNVVLGFCDGTNWTVAAK